VLERAGRTEAAVDLARLAGLAPAAADCEILTDEGERARGRATLDFCRAHGIRRVGVEDLVLHRVRADPLLERVAATAAGGALRLHAYRERVSGTLHLAVLGDGAGEPWAVHRHCAAGHLLGMASCDCRRTLTDAVERARESGGAVLMINVDLAALDGRPLGCVLDRERGAIDQARDDAVVAQIRRDLAGVAT